MPGAELKSPLRRGTSSRGYLVTKSGGKGWIYDFEKGKGGRVWIIVKGKQHPAFIVVMKVKIFKMTFFFLNVFIILLLYISSDFSDLPDMTDKYINLSVYILTGWLLYILYINELIFEVYIFSWIIRKCKLCKNVYSEKKSTLTVIIRNLKSVRSILKDELNNNMLKGINMQHSGNR